MGKRVLNKMPTKASELLPNLRNPRKITDERLAMLGKSMRAFGDLGGIVFNKRSGRLVGGHQRSKDIPPNTEVVIENRLKKESRTGTIATGYLEYEGERFNVRIVDWDDNTERAANLAANKQGGQFDLQILSEDLLHLDDLNIDMELTGFTAEDIEDLMAPKSDGKEVSFTVKDKDDEEESKCPNCGHSL